MESDEFKQLTTATGESARDFEERRWAKDSGIPTVANRIVQIQKCVWLPAITGQEF